VPCRHKRDFCRRNRAETRGAEFHISYLISGCSDHPGWDDAYETQDPILYTMNKIKRRSCINPPCLMSPAGCLSTDFSPPSLILSACLAFGLCLRVSFAMAINSLWTAALAFATLLQEGKPRHTCSLLGKGVVWPTPYCRINGWYSILNSSSGREQNRACADNYCQSLSSISNKESVWARCGSE
jgi:hypothetical protein